MSRIVAGIALGIVLGCMTVPVYAASPKLATLTFDDGPYGSPTRQALEVLRQKKVAATFFVMGQNVAKYPEILQQEVRDGNLVANHSWDHAKNLNTISSKLLQQNLYRTDQTIARLTGLHPRFFRPPYGYTSPSMFKTLHQLGYRVMMWNDDPRDWDKQRSAAEIDRTVLAELHPGAIIILHDGRDTHVDYPRDNLIQALPQLIDQIRQAGYTLVRLDQLTGQKPYL